MRVKAIILFWSVSGTTRRVAESVALGIRRHGIECDLHDLGTGLPADLAPYDLVGVGAPVHYYRLPAPVTDAIDGLGWLGSRSAFAFTLNATDRGDGLNRLREALSRTGAVQLGVFACRGEGRFVGYARLGYQFSPGHPTDAELEAAGMFGTHVARAHQAVLRGESAPPLPPRDPRTHIVYAVERALTVPWLTRVVHSRFVGVDKRRCTRCGLCARRCPTGAIAFEKGRLPVWGSGCVLCGTCVEVCPEEAVHWPIDWPVFAPFLRHNVNRALRDCSLDHVQVEMKRGKFVRRNHE